MAKKDFYRFLDQPERLPDDDRDRELAQLMKEVEGLESPDPGPDYWNQFNHRLQARIDRLPPRRSFRRLWLDLPLAIGAAAALALALIMLEPWRGEPPGLETLSASELALLADAFEPLDPDGEPPAPEQEESDWSLLIELYEPAGDDLFAGAAWRDIDPEAFAQLWNREG